MSRQERNIPSFVFDNLDNLKQDAQSQGYSLKDIGERTGFSLNFICGLASGTFSPTRNNYNKLSAVLHWKEWK